MGTPTNFDMVNHLSEHYGLPKMKIIEILRVPTHPSGLRDDFAGKAMQSIIQTPGAKGWSLGPTGADNKAICRGAYAVADAMLAERAK